MRPFCVPFGLLHHSHPSISLYDLSEDYAEAHPDEADLQEQTNNRDCAEIDEYAATMLSDTDFGEDGYEHRAQAAVSRFEAMENMLQDICGGGKDAIVEEHARAALDGSLMSAIETVLRRCEGADVCDGDFRAVDCIRAIRCCMQRIRICAAEILGVALD